MENEKIITEKVETEKVETPQIPQQINVEDNISKTITISIQEYKDLLINNKSYNVNSTNSGSKKFINDEPVIVEPKPITKKKGIF